jgi:hypothetical protein
MVRELETSVGDIVQWIPARMVPTDIVVKYDAQREFVETLTFELEADVQNLLTDPGEEEVLTIDVSAEVDQAIDPDDTSSGAPLLMPIRDRKARRYFQTARGLQSVQFLIAMARAQLVYRARAIEVSFEIPFDDGLDLSCRLMASISDNRLPGGTATGKIKSYSLSANGSNGDLRCKIVMGCTVGKGGTVAAVTGTPSLIESGGVEAGIQIMTGSTTAVVADQVTFGDISGISINDDGVDWDNLTAPDVIEEIEIINGADDQLAILEDELDGGLASDTWEIAAVFTEAYTQVRLDLISARGGPFETDIPVTTSLLKIAKQIDLEAAAT